MVDFNNYKKVKNLAFLVLCVMGSVYVGVCAVHSAGYISDVVNDCLKLGIFIILCSVGYRAGRGFLRLTHTTPLFLTAILLLAVLHVTELTEEFVVMAPVPLLGEVTPFKRAFETILMIGSFSLLLGSAYLAVFEISKSRRQMEDQYRLLDEKVQLNRKILHTMLDGVAIVDPDGRILYGNPSFCQMYGYSLEELLTTHPRALVHPDYHHELGRFFKDIQERGSFHGETKDVRKDGTQFHVEVQGAGIELEGRQCLLAVIRDATERKDAEKQLQEYQSGLRTLSYELSMTEERERRRIAAGLHDNVCQELVMIKVALKTLQQGFREPEVMATLERQCEIITRLLQETHSLVFDLSSPVLYEIGLNAAIASWLNHYVAGPFSIQCEFHSENGEFKLEKELNVLLFQSIRELVMNAVKHARAKTIQVTMGPVQESLQIQVKDDGIGFDPTSIGFTEEGGFGLFSIQERLRCVGGVIEVRSSSDHGTTVTMRVPHQTP